MNKLITIFFILLFSGSILNSQSLTQPRISSLSSISHRLGITDIAITYSSPQVRKRNIWGELVPYEKVWRAGADNNTIFETSHPLTINGSKLPAGKYGIHMIPSEKEWIIVFSKNHTSWGSFTYDESEDLLRVSVSPTEVNFQEHLSYQFEERGYDYVVASMIWEKVKIPFTIKANVDSIVIANFKQELRSKAQFDWQAWHQAAQYCLYNNVELGQGLEWVNYSMNGFFASKEVFENLQTKAGILEKMDSLSQAKTIMDKALDHPTATALDMYRYGRQLLSKNQTDRALHVFKTCKKRFPNHWLSEHGLARVYSALGEFEKAIINEENAIEIAPERSRPFLKENIQKLKNKEDFN